MAPTAARLAHATRGPAHKWWALAAVQTGNVMAAIDGTIVNVALPTILREFGIDIETVKWVAVGYLFTITVTLLTIGRLADMYGRKRVTVVGFAVFTVASALCGLAPSFDLLVACRVLQGIGAACMMANTMAIMAAVFPAEERGRAIGIQASVVAAAQMIGPTLGGVLVSTIGWRAIFLVNVPIGLLGLALSAVVLDEQRISEPRRDETFDLIGAALAASGIGLLFVGFERLADVLLDLVTVAALVGGLVALVLFAGVECRRPYPLLATQLFQARAFTLGSAATGLAVLASSATAFVMPFYLQVVLGFSPALVGLLITPSAIGVVIAGPLAGWLSNRVGTRLLSAVGLACGITAVLWLSTLRPDSHYLEVAIRLLLLGFGLGLFHPPNYAAVLASPPRERLGVASAYLSTMRILGQFLGASLSAEIVGTHLEGAGGLKAMYAGLAPDIQQRLAALYVDAQRLALQAAALVTAFGLPLIIARGSVPGPARAVEPGT